MLNLLFSKGPLSYTEIMNYLKLNPTRDAGRFAYHLKSLLKIDLIEPKVKTKKYYLTNLGMMILRFTDEIENSFHNKKTLLVRTSRASIEPFERNRITDSLTKEANVTIDQAEKIARDTEKRRLPDQSLERRYTAIENPQ